MARVAEFAGIPGFHDGRFGGVEGEGGAAKALPSRDDTKASTGSSDDPMVPTGDAASKAKALLSSGDVAKETSGDGANAPIGDDTEEAAPAGDGAGVEVPAGEDDDAHAS